MWRNFTQGTLAPPQPPGFRLPATPAPPATTSSGPKRDAEMIPTSQVRINRPIACVQHVHDPRNWALVRIPRNRETLPWKTRPVIVLPVSYIVASRCPIVRLLASCILHPTSLPEVRVNPLCVTLSSPPSRSRINIVSDTCPTIAIVAYLGIPSL